MFVPALDSAGIPYRLVGVSALEHFFDFPQSPVVTLEVDTDVVQLARTLDRLEFPGLPAWDATAYSDGREILIRAEDSTGTDSRHPLLRFTFDPARRAFYDPEEMYPLLREARSRLAPRRARRRLEAWQVEPVAVEGLQPIEAALLSATVPITIDPRSLDRWRDDAALPPSYHRLLLMRVLTGRFAWRGIDILERCGYLGAVIPELSSMRGTEHSKEGHPEGDAWQHTLETFRYRKTPDLALSLALMFHDSGKPDATERGGRRFDGHADLGARVAAKVLRRLEFDPELIDQVQWLCRYHMMPGALERLPDYRRDPLMRSPLFPILLELYRCDLSSTYRGPDGYYRACTIYRRYLKKQPSGNQPVSGEMVKLYVD